MKVPRRAKPALPDSRSLEPAEVVASSTAGEQAAAPDGGGKLPYDIGELLLDLRDGGASNALLVSARESEGGRPVAVMGPQVSYFSPQILMEMSIHAPAGPEGPPLDARGAAFPGTNLYVQLGHGRDYAWSATSAGQDIIDTFALPLCEPDGSKPGLDSTHYRFRDRCLAIDVLERTNAWTASPGDTTPSGSETYRAERTTLGIVTHRGEIRGKPYLFTKNRATYYHEVDSALGFADFNNPEKMESPKEFMKAACKIQYTFNWFFVDRKHVAYFNAGINPKRSPRAHPDLPTFGKHEWRGYTPPPEALLGEAVEPTEANVDPARTSPGRSPARRTRRRSIRTTSRAGTTSRRPASAPPTASGATGRSSARPASTTGSSRGSAASAR